MLECPRIPLFDGVLQVTDSFRRHNVNWKGFQIVESENTAVERDFSSHGRSVSCNLKPRDTSQPSSTLDLTTYTCYSLTRKQLIRSVKPGSEVSK